MESCEKEKEINDIKTCVAILKSRWKLLGTIVGGIITIIITGSSLMFYASGQVKDAQIQKIEKIESETRQKNKEQDKDLENLKIAVRAVEIYTENIKEDTKNIQKDIKNAVENFERQQIEILNGLKKFNKDDDG